MSFDFITLSSGRTGISGITKTKPAARHQHAAGSFLLQQRSVMRIRQQLEHLPVDDNEAPQLPDHASAHVAREAGGHGRIIGLLVGFAVGWVF